MAMRGDVTENNRFGAWTMNARRSRPSLLVNQRKNLGRASSWHATTLLVLMGIEAQCLFLQPVLAQDEVKNYKKPILTVETGGHHARVRSLLWQDASTLLSGGEDKVVKVWDFQSGARLARSLRPPIWRGPSGTIYAMAMTKPDGQGQSFLAVGGYGVESRRGDLTIFRVPGIERGPRGEGQLPSGEIVARLLSPPESQPNQIGHRNSVLCLAFDTAGGLLASGSKDTNVILWDVPAFRPRLVLAGHTGDVRALAFSPNGQRLATAGGDGSLRLWNVATGAQVDIRLGNPEHPWPINTLGFSPDGQSILVGRENGDLFRFNAANLAQPPAVKLPTLGTQGPVEFLTYSPDGQSLAVSLKSDKADTLDPLTIACDVEIRTIPAGNVIRRWRVPGLVHSLAFSPGNDRLAYSGGPAQSIFIQNMANLDAPQPELKGQGSTPFDLGFTADSQVVGFSRDRFDPANPPPIYEAFDLARRKSLNVSGIQLQHAIKSLNGWTLTGSILNYRLEAVNQDGRRWRCDLSPETERNWWSYTMIPPGPGHTRPVVAVGCESGVVLYDLETGRRTRMFAGHSGPVVAVVPSPDGRWLGSSALDQTIMLYPLAGCDIRPGFGASFQQRQPDRAWIISGVERRGFADGMGLRPGDVVLRAGITEGQGRPTFYDSMTMEGFVRRVDELKPGLDQIAIWVRRLGHFPTLGMLEVDLPPLPSTKRNNAVMTLMLGADKEWVVWTPQGFYDTSIEGDSRFLGWHINADFRLARPTDFVPIGTYARSMLQPRVLERLWQTADPGLALALASPAAGIPAPSVQAYDQRPPRITFASIEGGIRLPAPGVVWLVRVPNPRLSVNIQAEGSSRISSRRAVFDEQAKDFPPLPGPTDQITENLALDLAPNRRVRLAVEAVNESGMKRTETIDMVYLPPSRPPPPETRSRLVVLSVGVDQSLDERLLPRVTFADKDAIELAGFVSGHLISPDGTRPVQNRLQDVKLLTANLASANSIEQALDSLGDRLRNKQLRKGDIVIVVIVAHVLEIEGTSVIAATDTNPGKKPVPNPVIPVREISERLGELADYGCRVVVLLDGVHELPNDGFRSTIKPWVRDLQLERRVITFVASKEGPSSRDVTTERGLFAEGILNAFRGPGSVGAQKDATAAYTLEQFRRAVHKQVQELSGRIQEADVFIPLEVDPQTLFASP